MLFSIIVPVYNSGAFLRRCLDSILKQKFDYKNYEIILVDDGSTDESWEIVQEYENSYKNIKAIHKENSGVSATRNIGLTFATGDYIWFIDSDDYIHENSLVYLSGIIKDYSPDYILFNYIRTTTEQVCQIELEGFEIRKSDNGYVELNNCYAGGACFYCIKRDIINKENIKFNEKIKYAEDSLFINEIKVFSLKVIATEAPLYIYFQHNTSAMHNVNHAIHCTNMLLLSKRYKEILEKDINLTARKKTEKNKIRAMQHCLTDLCLYCADKNIVKNIISYAKEIKCFPCKMDWGNFKINRRQSKRSDLMNWLFAAIVKEPYFWLVWFLCGVIRKKKAVKFDLSSFIE